MYLHILINDITNNDIRTPKFSISQQHITYLGLVPPDSPVDFAGDQLSSYIPPLMSIPVCNSPWETLLSPYYTLCNPSATPQPAVAVPWVMGTSWRVGWSLMGREATVFLPGFAGLRKETVNLFFPLLPHLPLPPALPHHLQKGPWAHSGQKAATTFTQPLFSKPCVFKSTARL